MSITKELESTRLRQERRVPMSYEAFLAAADEDTHAEWVNGEAIFFMPPNSIHQDIVGFLYTLLRTYIKFFLLGQVFVAPYEMKVSPDSSGREPDILFIATKNLVL
jgi:Uma2 family endonuclease